MLYRFRFAIIGLSLLVVSWTGYKIYGYFFDNTLPAITMNGIADDGFYAGDISCKVSSNKKGDLSVWLDGQPLISRVSFEFART